MTRRRHEPRSTPQMSFGLGEVADALRETVARFAAAEIALLAAEIDRSDSFPRQLWPKMGALGLHGITVEEDWGGAGLGYLEHCVAMEEVSRASASVGCPTGALELVRQPDPLQRHGRAEAALPAAAPVRGGRRPRHVGGRGGFRRALDAACRRKARRPLGHQRHEDVDHERPATCSSSTRARAPTRSRPFSSRPRSRASWWRRSSTSSACAARPPANSCSPTARCRTRTCSARRAAASACS